VLCFVLGDVIHQLKWLLTVSFSKLTLADKTHTK